MSHVPFTEQALREMERRIPTNAWAVTVDVDTYRRLISEARRSNQAIMDIEELRAGVAELCSAEVAVG